MSNKKEQSLTDNKFNGKIPKKPFQKTHKQYYNPSKHEKKLGCENGPFSSLLLKHISFIFYKYMFYSIFLSRFVLYYPIT